MTGLDRADVTFIGMVAVACFIGMTVIVMSVHH